MIFNYAYEDAKKHAIAEYPREACGIVADGKYIPCNNVAKESDGNFIIDPKQINKYIKNKSLDAVIHSHPCENIFTKTCPSKQDMIGQVSTDVPWGIIDTDGIIARDPFFWGDFLFSESLLGKQFHSGINDCYSIIRKFYFQRRNITLPEFPRDDCWWSFGENLYMEGFEKARFYRITASELKDGDIILCKIRSNVINHAGIYLDNPDDGKGLILHHLPNRLSRREPAQSWINKSEIFLRHKDAA